MRKGIPALPIAGVKDKGTRRRPKIVRNDTNIIHRQVPDVSVASIAQWQSTALVKQGSWVQTPLGASFSRSHRDMQQLFVFHQPIYLHLQGILCTIHMPKTRGEGDLPKIMNTVQFYDR